MVSPEEVLSKRVICEPLTIAMSAPTGDGGAAVVLCSEEFLLKHNLQVFYLCAHDHLSIVSKLTCVFRIRVWKS